MRWRRLNSSELRHDFFDSLRLALDGFGATARLLRQFLSQEQLGLAQQGRQGIVDFVPDARDEGRCLSQFRFVFLDLGTQPSQLVLRAEAYLIRALVCRIEPKMDEHARNGT